MPVMHLILGGRSSCSSEQDHLTQLEVACCSFRLQSLSCLCARMSVPYTTIPMSSWLYCIIPLYLLSVCARNFRPWLRLRLLIMKRFSKSPRDRMECHEGHVWGMPP